MAFRRLSFWAGSIFLRRGGDDAPLRAVEAAAILFTVLLAFMEIRHAVNNGDVYRHSAGLTEIALQVCVALAMAIGLERLRIRTGSIVHNVGAILLTAFAGLAHACSDCCCWRTRCCWPIDVGGGFINLLLLGYALPAVLALLLSYAVAGRRPVAYANTIAAGALILALDLCHLRNPPTLSRPGHGRGPTTGAEQYTYSIAWLAFGVALLGIGILFNSQRARLASAAVIALTILKAFLIDMSTLTGVYRALSFMCLGLVLVAIGWLYQRILFRRQAAAPPPRRRRQEVERSGGPDRVEEFADLELEPVALARQRLRRRIAPATRPIPSRSRRCCTSVMLDETCCVPVAACWMLREISCVAAPCSSTAAAMVEEISDIRPMVPPISLIAVTEFLGRGLDARDLLADLAGRLRGLLGQRLDLGCDDRKAAAGLAGARRLDRGIERQQVGLAGDGVDQLDHVADAACRLRQLADALVGLLGLVHGLAGNTRDDSCT